MRTLQECHRVRRCTRRQRAAGSARPAAPGFSLAELLVAAVVLFVASLGLFQALGMMARHTEHHQRDLEADQLVRSTLGYLRDIGYDGLVASGSGSVAQAIAGQYEASLRGLGSGAALALSWQDTIPGSMLDATVSVSYQADASTQSIVLATRIAKGGPL